MTIYQSIILKFKIYTKKLILDINILSPRYLDWILIARLSDKEEFFRAHGTLGQIP
jgi:hypothetical protein